MCSRGGALVIAHARELGAALLGKQGVHFSPGIGHSAGQVKTGPPSQRSVTAGKAPGEDHPVEEEHLVT